MSKRHMPADVVTIIGTQDIVYEEVDIFKVEKQVIGVE